MLLLLSNIIYRYMYAVCLLQASNAEPGRKKKESADIAPIGALCHAHV